LSRGETNALVRSVENGVIPLEERVAEDAACTERTHHEVDIVGCAADLRVERTGKDLRVCDEFEFRASDIEEERLEVLVLIRWNVEYTCLCVKGCTSRIAVAIICIYIGGLTLSAQPVKGHGDEVTYLSGGKCVLIQYRQCREYRQGCLPIHRIGRTCRHSKNS
jgi:hypothetical protein